MFYVILGLIALAAGVLALVNSRRTPTTLPVPAGTPRPADAVNIIRSLLGSGIGAILLIAVGLAMLASTSFVNIDATKVGHLKRIYGYKELPPGRIIALEGQKGPQAEILGPGFHFIPLVQVLYTVEQFDIVKVPEGFYGEIVAVDGAPMPEGMFIAPQIPDKDLAAMMQAEHFLTRGGHRGPQETVLKPGEYRLNRYLFNVRVDKATTATVIPAGHVGVVKSNVSKPGTQCIEQEVKAADGAIEGALSVPLVPPGCVGIWREPLLPGAYYLNRKAYEISLIDTRVKTWEYKGGYTKRIIDLSVDQQGNIRQVERTEVQAIPKDAADRAVFVKVEGWDIPQELRVLVQVNPKNAPIVVGAVGGLEEIEDRILTPAIRSIVRNVAGSDIEVPDPNDPTKRIKRQTRVLDLIENREALEQAIETAVKREGRKAGVEIQEIRLGEPAIPPELLVSRLREQLADQLTKAYERESTAQSKRIETEQARATANEQPRLVESQIAVQVASQREKERATLGRAERQYLEELARGQQAQAQVLGQDRVSMLQALEKVLSSLEKKPELATLIGRLVPQIVVGSGGGEGLAGAAAILSGVLGQQPNASAASQQQPAPARR